MKSKGKTIFCDKHQYIITLGGFQKITNDYRRGGGSVNDYLLKNEIYNIFFQLYLQNWGNFLANLPKISGCGV